MALVAATAVWASTFLVTKQSLDAMAPAAFLTWRFGAAAVVLFLVSHRQVVALDRVERRRATVLGVLLGGGFLLQTTGLLTASAGLSGFLTGASVVLVPVVARLAFAEQVPGAGWVAVGLAGVGVGLLAGGFSGGLSLGAALTLAGAACFAGHIAGLSAWATRANAVGLTAWSVAVAALLTGSASLLGGGLTVPTDRQTWAAVAYLALLATCLGFVGAGVGAEHPVGDHGGGGHDDGTGVRRGHRNGVGWRVPAPAELAGWADRRRRDVRRRDRRPTVLRCHEPSSRVLLRSTGHVMPGIWTAVVPGSAAAPGAYRRCAAFRRRLGP